MTRETKLTKKKCVLQLKNTYVNRKKNSKYFNSTRDIRKNYNWVIDLFI